MDNFWELSTWFFVHIIIHRIAFQLLGVDLDLDSDMKPWLIESNVNPYLWAHVTWEREDKLGMIKDMFEMLQIVPREEEIQRWIAQFILTLNLHSLKKKILKSPKSSELSEEELDAVVDLVWENQKRGSWERLFPAVESMEYYMQFSTYQQQYSKIFDWIKEFEVTIEVREWAQNLECECGHIPSQMEPTSWRPLRYTAIWNQRLLESNRDSKILDIPSWIRFSTGDWSSR